MNWLLLRGLTREQRHWNDFPQVLQGSMSGSQVFCLDLPGVGTEIHRSSPTSVAQMTDDIRSRWIPFKQQHSGPWNILGISLGGMITMDWCARYAGDFQRAVIINSSAANLSLPWQRMKWNIMPQLIPLAMLKDPAERERVILNLTTGMVKDHDIHAIAQHWASFAGDRVRLSRTFARQIIAATLFKAPPALHLPSLVLSSLSDGFTDPSCSRRIAERFGSHLECHPDAGHELALDDPHWIAAKVSAWVK